MSLGPTIVGENGVRDLIQLWFATPVNPWVNVCITGISAVATTVIAGYVAAISARQWRTNREKLRLDLYNRRFEIYIRVLGFYQELIQWEGSSEQVERQAPFIKAYAESRFMFPPQSGVYEYLKEFSGHAFKIVQFKKTVEALSSLPEETTKLALERSNHANWILVSMAEIERKMGPYLNFHDF